MMRRRLICYPCPARQSAAIAATESLIGLDAVLVASVRDGHLLDQIPLENGCLLVRTEASSRRSHGILLVQGLILARTTETFHFQLVQDSRCHASQRCTQPTSRGMISFGRRWDACCPELWGAEVIGRNAHDNQRCCRSSPARTSRRSFE
jgi:hypothetical protein